MLLAEPGAVALAGGQSLIPALCLGELRAHRLVDLTRIQALRGVALEAGRLRVGAGVPMWELERNSLVRTHAPLLARALATVGAPPIRSRATLGGAAGWSEPTSQLPATLIALDALLLTNQRTLQAEGFFTGPQRNLLAPGELIVAIELPSSRQRSTGLAHVRRSAITWPVCGCAVCARVEDGVIAELRISLYGAGERPLAASSAAQALCGRSPSAEHLQEAGSLALAQASPPSDERASASYRRTVLPVLVRRALQQAFEGAAR